MQELEAARPDSGKKPQNGRETRDYWIKFAAATERYTAEEIKVAYNMAPSTARNEIGRAKRIVARIREIELLERGGQTMRQTYFPPDLLSPGQQIYSTVSTSTKPSLVVALQVKTEQSNKIETPMKSTHLLNVKQHSGIRYPKLAQGGQLAIGATSSVIQDKRICCCENIVRDDEAGKLTEIVVIF